MSSFTTTNEPLKLPTINSTRSSSIGIESSTSSQNEKTTLDRVKSDILKLEEKKSKNESIDNDLTEIKTDLIKHIVNTLMNNNDKDWQFLFDYFSALAPISMHLENDKRINHYLERIFFVSSRSINRDCCSRLINLLTNIFPNTIEFIKMNGTPRSFSNSVKAKNSKDSSFSLVPDPKINFYEGKLNPYKNQLKDVRFKPGDGPTIKEVTDSIRKVTYESYKLESNWKQKVSNLTIATGLNFDELENDINAETTRKSLRDDDSDKQLFKPVGEDDRDSIYEVNYIQQHFSREAPNFDEKCLNLTGRDMVFHLLKSTHLADPASYYLNKVESKLYRPYDLITVPKSKANPEHYVFSVFGVIHMLPGEENERLTLEEWNRFAILWEACSKIKFFKQFLFRKFLQRWRQNSKFSKFLKLKSSISKNILIAVPNYAESLLALNRLLNDISELEFLPGVETQILESKFYTRGRNVKGNVIEKKVFTLEKFNMDVYTLNERTDKILEYLFVYVRYILDHTRKKYYDKLRFYEKLLNQVHPMEISKSLSVQTNVISRREKELAKVNHEIGLLGNFINLVSTLIGYSMLKLAQNEIKKFLEEFELCKQSKREPLFCAELGFNKEEKLTMVPLKSAFVSQIMRAVSEIANSVTDASRIIDFQGTLKDMEKYGFDLLSYDVEEEEIDNMTDAELKEKKPEVYYRKLINDEPKNFPIKKPVLNMKKDYDEGLLNRKLVIPYKEEKLRVYNFILKAQSNPLNPLSISSIINNDEQLRNYTLRVQDSLTESTNEIEAYCAENTWLNEIRAYVIDWKSDKVLEWKQVGAYEIEDQLSRIRAWTETIKTGMEKTIITQNRILKVDTTPVERTLVPKLDSIYKDICEITLAQIGKDSLAFIDDIKKIIKDLDDKPKTIEEFADYAKRTTAHKANVSVYEAKANLIKALLEVIRINYRVLTSEEEQLDSQTQELWKSLLSKLQESVEFINLQSPQILEQLDNLLKKYTEELKKIHNIGTTGKYLDPSQNSTQILEELKDLCDEFETVEKILNQCKAWRESIVEQPVDISFVALLKQQLNTRKDLWKYYQVAYHHIKDWKNTPIKKINVKKVEEKLTFWEAEAQKLKKLLNDNEDKVWLCWWDLLVSFKVHMKWISKLASDTFQNEHFEELFSALGLVYNPKEAYTIQNLIDLHIPDYYDLINAIYRRALNESNYLQQFNFISESWNTKLKFKLAKNFPIKVYVNDKDQIDEALNQRKIKSYTIKELKDKSLQQIEEQTKLMSDVTYKLVDIDEIRYNAEDSFIKLKIITESKANKKIKENAQELMTKIKTILNLSELWLEVQHKWLFLDRAFFVSESQLRGNQNVLNFNQCVQEFKDFQHKINADPIVMNIIKEESYQKKLDEWNAKFEGICKNFDNLIDQSCVEFARFYFVGREKLIETLSHMRDCRKYMEVVRLCFPSIGELSYALPPGVAKDMQTSELNQLALDIHAADLEVVGFFGSNGNEYVKFFTPLRQANLQKASEWFSNLSKIIKSSLCKQAHTYLDKLELHNDYSTVKTIDKRVKDINGIAFQIVLLGEVLLWGRNVLRIIQTKKFEDFKLISNYFKNSIGQFSQMQTNDCDPKLRELYAKLIIAMIYYKDLTQTLADSKNLNEYSFEWLRVLKYTYEKRVLLKNAEDDLEIPGKTVKMENKYENLSVNQMTTTIAYDFEYHDCASQLIISPVTERSFLNLTAALKSFQCGGLIAPLKCGKRETLYLLAQACGQHLQEIHCNQAIDLNLSDRYLNGLANSGSWVLFNKIDQLDLSVISSISFQLDYLRNAIKSLLDKDANINPTGSFSKIQERASTGHKTENKGQRVNTVPFYFESYGLKTYFEDAYDESEVSKQPPKPVKWSQLKLKGEELKKIEEIINYGQNRPDLYYQRKYLGYIRFQGRIIKVSTNYGCFLTCESYKKLPEILRTNLRTCKMIEPDLNYVTYVLMMSHGLNQGLSNVDVLAKKLVDFLTLLPLTIPNEFTLNCKNIHTIRNIVKLTAMKYKLDKGRQERVICLILTSIFAACFKDHTDKSIFNLLLKRMFDFEGKNFIEELLSNLIKDQLAQDGLRINNKQIQKMIDLYTSLRFNQFALLAGPPLDGKSTIWKTISRAVNSLQTIENLNNQTKSTEIFKKYSMLINFLNEDQRFPKILVHHLFPNVYNQLELNKSSKPNEFKQNLLNQFIEQSINCYDSINSYQKEVANNKKIVCRQLENWMLLDSSGDEIFLLDQLILLKGEGTFSNSNIRKIPDTVKFVIETSNLNHINPSVLSNVVLIVQQELEWKYVLETKLNDVCFKYSVPQSKNLILQEYSNRYFSEIYSKFGQLSFRSRLHDNKKISDLNFLNFIIAYANLVDCMLKKFADQLKQTIDDDISNWRALKPLSSYAFFWSIASFLNNENDLRVLNELITEIIVKNSCELASEGLKLYESELDVKLNALVAFQKNHSFTTSKDWIIPDYQYQASLIRLCMNNSQPCLVFGDVGVGKTSLIEKILTNKYDFSKLTSIEPESYIYDSLLKQAPFVKSRKYSSVNGYRNSYVFFIEDLNVNYEPNWENRTMDAPSTTNLELARQIMEMKCVYSSELKLNVNLDNLNFLLTCSYPARAPNYRPLSERLTKHFVCVNLDANASSLVESIFYSPVQNWLEEFPSEYVLYPIELAQSIIKSMGEIYTQIRENLKPTPNKPHYLFNFKDVCRVLQGLQLLASKSKVIPKVSRRARDTQEQASSQIITIIKLYCHEIMRVFADRLTDVEDEKWLKTLLVNNIRDNFCTIKEMESSAAEISSSAVGTHTRKQLFETQISETMTGSPTSTPPKPRKAVTFKTGLVNDREQTKPHNGSLVTVEQLGLNNEEAFLNSIFSKFIISKLNTNTQKGATSSDRTNYTEANLIDLMNSATIYLDTYEKNKNAKLNFFFHENALRQLAHLTRAVSINGGNALLVSLEPGLGRTNLVRFCAFLSKMKYYESRITNDQEKSERYLKSVLRHCCLVSGIKGSNTIVYVKSEFHSPKILRNLSMFAKTGIYPNLFSEEEIWSIASEITPSVVSTKRVERTMYTYNSFINSIRDKVHLIISLDSGLHYSDTIKTLRQHSSLISEFYVDIYKPLRIDALNSLARYYLTLQIEENLARKLNKKLNRYYSDMDEENMSQKEIQQFASSMVEMHSMARDAYTNFYLANKNFNRNQLAPKPFTVLMFKQFANYFLIYMRRIKQQETIKCEKFERAFRKINEINEKLKEYERERHALKESLDKLAEELRECDAQIERQKETYRAAVDECRKEEKLIEEMTAALEKLKADVNKDTHDFNNLYSQQYEMALKAIQSLSSASFNELRSYRAPPARLLAVVNTLCLMFRQPPGWESAKLLLLREEFFDDLIFYDKRNIPDDIFNALEQICACDTFKPELIAPVSQAAASFCLWIITIYQFSKFERTIGYKTRELKEFQELYNQRLINLGEKRLNAEKECQTLEAFCQNRLNVLKEIKKTHVEIENLAQREQKATQLLKLLDEDNKMWISQYNKSLSLLKSYKLDALLTAFYVAYAGVFDSDKRRKLLDQSIACLNRLFKENNKTNIKFELKTPIQEEEEQMSNLTRTNDHHGSININKKKDESNSQEFVGKLSLRNPFNLREILIDSHEHKDVMIQINKLALRDDHFVNNALLLREMCALPGTINWPLIYDPENFALKVLSLMQESIDDLKSNLVSEYVASEGSAPVVDVPPSDLMFKTSHFGPRSEDLLNINESLVAELETIPATSNARTTAKDDSIASGDYDDDRLVESSSQQNIERVESLPPYSMQSSRMSGRLDSKSGSPKSDAGRSSIWEASTFYSRSQTTATLYQTKSGKPFLPSINKEFESPINVPMIESDLNVLPKDNLCVLDSSDPELDYKLINAAVHGVAVFLKNAERFAFDSRLVDILIERDFMYDAASAREYLKFDDVEFTINPAFKLILHTNTPACMKSAARNNHLFQRFIAPSSAAHFVVDFTPSSAFIANDFLYTVMEYEKYGFNNQLHLADKILFEAEYNIFARQEEIIERLNTIDQSILEDKNMLSYATDKNVKLKEFNDSHSESIHIEKTLKEISKSYVKVSKTIGSLFESLKLVQTIQPSYYINWSLMKKLLLSEIEPFIKDKGAAGPARAKQIETYVLTLFYRYLSSCLSNRHLKLLLFIHSMLMLSGEEASNSIRPAKKSQDYHHEPQTAGKTRAFKLLSIALKQNELTAIANDYDQARPDYLNLNSWLNMKRLERDEPDSFRDLTKSLMESASKWVEYFQFGKSSTTDVVEKDIDLINQTPASVDASLLDKLALWLCARPEKTSEIVGKFNIYNLGGLIPNRLEFDLNSSLKLSTPNTFMFVRLQNDQNAYVNATIEISKMAKQTNEDIKVIVVSLENNDSKLKRLGVALRDSIKNGYWIVVENVHILDTWPKDVLKLLYQIKDSNYSREELDLWTDYNLNIPENRINGDSIKDEKLFVHENFRLWLLADANYLHNIPESLIYDSIKLTPQISDLKQTYVSCKQECNVMLKKVKPEIVEEASILHSLMTHNEFKTANLWSSVEFFDYVKLANELDNLILDADYDFDQLFFGILKEMIYCSKVENKVDHLFAKKIIYQIQLDKKYQISQLIENSDKFYNMGEKREESSELLKELQMIVEVNYNRGQVDSNGVTYRSIRNTKPLYEMTDSLQINIINLNTQLANTMEKLDSIKQKVNDASDLTLYSLEIADYLSVLGYLAANLTNLLDLVHGTGLVDNRTFYFYHRYVEADERQILFDLTGRMLANIGRLYESISNELECKKIALTAAAASQQQSKSFNLNNKLNVDVMAQPGRALCRLLVEKYNLRVKNHQKEKPVSLETIAANSSSSVSNSFLTKMLDFEEKIFTLEVVDTDVETRVVDDEYTLYVENLCVVNANYEIVSKSFQSTLKKVINKLSMVRLRPLLAEEMLNQTAPDNNKSKYVPLVDVETHATICFVAIKFIWQNNQTSLSNTTSEQRQTTDRTVESSQKYYDAESTDPDRNSTAMGNQSSVTLANKSVPFYAPIYFSLHNSTHSFVRNLLDDSKIAIIN